VSLDGSWSFTVTHGGTVYRCAVNDTRIEITAPSGMTMDAKWTGSRLGAWSGFEGDIQDEQIPDTVIGEAEAQVAAMAEAVAP